MNSKLLALAVSTLIAAGVGAAPSVAFAADGEADFGAQERAEREAQRAEAERAEAERARESADLEQKLADARARLEEAAHEVAELSSELGGPLVDKFMVFNDDYRSKAVIGVQLDPESGKDGARIQEVSPGGPAQEAGLRVGDVITQVNGTDIKGDRPARAVVKLMQKVEPEKKVTLRVLRDGKPRDFVVMARRSPTFLGMNKNYFAAPLPPLPAVPAVPAVPGVGIATFGPVIVRGALGQMELVTLTPQLGRYFGTDKGVLVVRAPKDFKLEDGDVILAIDGREPSSGSHATRILASYQPGEKISIKLMRQQKAVNVEATLPERRSLLDPGDEEERGHRTKMIPNKGPGATT